MLEIKIKRHGKFYDVDVRSYNSVIELGFLNEKERRELVQTLREAADELSEGLEPED